MLGTKAPKLVMLIFYVKSVFFPNFKVLAPLYSSTVIVFTAVNRFSLTSPFQMICRGQDLEVVVVVYSSKNYDEIICDKTCFCF